MINLNIRNSKKKLKMYDKIWNNSHLVNFNFRTIVNILKYLLINKLTHP